MIIMKKIIALLLVAMMCFCLVSCGEGAAGKNGKKESAVVTIENWKNYFEVGVHIDDSGKILMHSVYLRAKEGVAISNEVNTKVHFSYNMSKQHYTFENNKIVLEECESEKTAYTDCFVLNSNENSENYYYEHDGISGAQWNLQGGNYWAMIPGDVAITEIEGTITAEK